MLGDVSAKDCFSALDDRARNRTWQKDYLDFLFVVLQYAATSETNGRMFSCLQGVEGL